MYVGASMHLLEKGRLQWYLEEGFRTICELEPESEQWAQMTYVKHPLESIKNLGFVPQKQNIYYGCKKFVKCYY